MKQFKISVNGVTYDVEVEEVQAGSSTVSIPVTPVAQSAASPAAKPVSDVAPASAPAAVPAGAETVDSPMPGTILSVAVAAGATVSAGDVLMVLEAMKMENEIVAPRDGEVAAVHVGAGASVDAGQALVSLK